MSPAVATRFRLLASAVSVLLLALLVASAWYYSRLRASLPQLDGSASAAGLGADVTIERDALGIPTIHAKNRADAARALGYLHGQDRFFQMDLLRRKGAGELSEIFGRAALPLDKAARRNEFRAMAQQVMAKMTPERKEVIQAYADGVNEGLSSLRAKPFEYYVLRTEPQPWKVEDCILVGFSMVLTLTDSTGNYEHSLDTLRIIYGDKALAFFAPLETPADAAVDGTTAPLPPIPGPEIIDLRKSVAYEGPSLSLFRSTDIPGSNSLAVSGSHTTSKSAVLANDMHLDLAMPNTWYRASLIWGDHRLTGFTIPGSPYVISGSNGKIAWGLTVAEIDVGDLIVVTKVPTTDLYRVPNDDMRPFETRTATIKVKGSAPETVSYDWTIWGPIVGQNAEGRALAYHWSELQPDAINLGISQIEDSESVAQAIDAAHKAGLPPLNFLVADSQGHIGWTVTGAVPKRVGFDGRLPNEWAYGDRRWDGFLSPDQVPSVQDPADGLLWTANNRIVGGDALKILGDGGYARPARGAQVRDDLLSLVQANPTDVKPADLLKIELDDRAVVLERWRTLLLNVLTPEALAGHPDRADLRSRLQTWDGRASVDSVSYGIVRAFHSKLAGFVFDPIFKRCRDADPRFSYNSFHWEEPLWVLVQAKPAHLLQPYFKSWDDLILGAADSVIRTAQQAGGLDNLAWGKTNTLRMRHPFSLVLPAWMTSWLNMPAQALPGDNEMPRVQSPTFGASERFAVSPGHEDEGISEMPGGESGHPLSPYYRAGHEAWAKGEAAPFLPGRAEHTLILRP